MRSPWAMSRTTTQVRRKEGGDQVKPLFSLQSLLPTSTSGSFKKSTDDFSSEDSDGETPASARAASASAASKKNKKGRPTANDGGGGGGSEQQRARRREGKKAAAAEEEAREELEEDEEQEHWVHCDRCSRWRVVPSEFWPSVENDPRPHWFCEWARWDVRAQPPYEAACPQR